MAKRTAIDDVVFLKGNRLYLRPPAKADIPRLLKWVNDPEITQYLGMFLPVTETYETEWIERIHKDKENIIFIIVEMKTCRPIGVMGIHRISWKDGRASTGSFIGEKEFQDKGYGSEAKMLLLNFAFNTLNLRKICSSAFGFNTRSQAYSKKCGYKVEGILKAHHFKNGSYCDDVQMAVFKEDWLPIWERFQKTGRV